MAMFQEIVVESILKKKKKKKKINYDCKIDCK